MSQSLQVQDASPITRTSTPDPTASKPLVNPLKVLKTFSSNQDSSNEQRPATQRFILGDPVDLGDVCLDGPWLGLRLASFGGPLQSVCWSTSGLTVSSVDHISSHL